MCFVEAGESYLYWKECVGSNPTGTISELKTEDIMADNKDNNIRRHIKRFCPKCAKWYYEDKCTCEDDKE